MSDYYYLWNVITTKKGKNESLKKSTVKKRYTVEFS